MSSAAHEQRVQAAKDAIDAVASDNSITHGERLRDLYRLIEHARYEAQRICPETWRHTREM